MKQFWLGMTSKIAAMRENVKGKQTEKLSEPSENAEVSQEDALPEGYLSPEPETAPAQETKFKRPFRQPVAEDVSAGGEPFAEPRKPVSLVKILIVTFLLLLIGAGAGGYYYISNIDWNQHKDKIAAEFSNITGKRIIFDGPVHLTLLPSPNLRAEDVKIYNPGEDLDEPLAKIKSLTADLTLGALINGDFDVTMMTLEEPDIRLEIMEDGSLNWESSLTDEQRANLETMQITLDSVMIEKAKLNLIDTGRDVNLTLDNLNAEVIAQSIFGPYRIEGTYIKDNNPEGFAFSIGKLASGFATTVNLVINQPATETFVRFDGSVLVQNNAVNGNLIFESKKLMEFINSNFKDIKLASEYDYPLAVALEVKSNKTKVELTNFVMKYGTTAGAGNVLIPLPEEKDVSAAEGEEAKAPRSKVELVFNFTDLDLDPAVKGVMQLLKKYNQGEANYNPDIKFDLLGDIKSVRTSYRGQNIKEFKLSFDLIDNKINIRDLSAVLPGDAASSIKGDIYSDLGYFTFNLVTNFKTDEFLQTLKWLEIQPETNQDTVLRRISATANVAGNYNKISISPFELTVDKSTIKGTAGIINDEKFNLYLDASSDMINFDNYIKPLPKGVSDKGFAERMNFRFGKIGFLNDIYAELRLRLDLGIYEGIPFENVFLDGSLQKGELQLKDLNIANVANAAVNLKGKVKGFGSAPVFENLKYDVATKDFSSFLNKLDIKAPDIDLKVLKTFSSKGIVTGSLERMAMKTVSKLDYININYGGQASRTEEGIVFNGDLEVKSRDFVKMLNDFNVKYEPKAFALGMFALKGKLVGKPDYFALNPVDFNIGANTFKGNVNYDNTSERKIIAADLDVNKFELEKFFYNEALIKDKSPTSFRETSSGKADFLAKPFFDATKLNYAFYNTFDFDGTFKISRLSYQDTIFDFADFKLSLKDMAAKLEHFKADYHGGKINADLELGISPDRPSLKGNVQLNQYKIFENTFNGGKYGLKDGTLNAEVTFNTSAESFDAMFNQLNADIAFAITDTRFLGWNLQEIYKNLLTRETSDGLTMFVKNNLQKGEEALQSVQGKLRISNGEYHLDNVAVTADQFNMTLTDNGSVANWETNANFSLKYLKPDYLPGFAFSYSGSLMTPVLDVNTDDLAVMYNKRQADLEAQNEALRQAERDRLAKELNDRLLVVKAAESEIQNVLRPDLQSKTERAKSPEALDGFKAVEERIKKLEASLAELQLMAKTPEIDTVLLQNMGRKNDENSTELQEIRKAIEANNITDLKFVINDSYNQITEQNNQAKKLAADYRAAYADLGKRLSAIVTGYDLNRDANVKRLKERLEGNILAIDNIVGSVQSDYVKIQASKNNTELEKYVNDINTQLFDAQKYVPSITQTSQELLNYANERVKIEEEAYKKKKEEEEIKRKLEENTGSISVKGTGVSKTVVRDLEDIEKAETAVENKDVKVLNFGAKNEPAAVKPAAAKAQASQSETPEDNGGGLVVRTQGKISKASGVIIKK